MRNALLLGSVHRLMPCALRYNVAIEVTRPGSAPGHRHDYRRLHLHAATGFTIIMYDQYHCYLHSLVTLNSIIYVFVVVIIDGDDILRRR